MTFEACTVHNRDHYGAPTTRGGNQGQVLGTQSASRACPQAHRVVQETLLTSGFVVARAMTRNEVLRLSGTQWLRQGLVAKRNGLD